MLSIPNSTRTVAGASAERAPGRPAPVVLVVLLALGLSACDNGSNGGGGTPLGVGPQLTGIGPASGSSVGGYDVVLAGANFTAAGAGPTRVLFDGVDATAVTILGSGALTCVAPGGTPGAAVDVEVRNDLGSDASTGGFLYHPTPSLTAVTAPTGSSRGGTPTVLTGTGFQNYGASGNVVLFGTTPAVNVTVVSDTVLTCDTPSGPPGTSVDVTAVNSNGAFALAGAYTFHDAPEITAVAPPAGPAAGGTAVTITGSGFVANGAGPNAVTFDGVPATNVVTVDDTTITCDSPPGTAGPTVDVAVDNANGTGTLAGAYSYTVALAIDWALPSSGTSLGGTSVSVIGAGFQDGPAGTNSVTFDGVPATSVVVVDDAMLTCSAPAGTPNASVDVTVTNANGVVTLVDGYTYHALPSVVGVSPVSGPSVGGGQVTVTGSGFQLAGAGTNAVAFGATPATGVSVLSDSTLVCDAPAGTAGAVVDVTVTNANGAGSLASAYRYHDAPTLTTVAPGSGPATGGVALTLSGTGFQIDGAGTNTVLVGGVPATGVAVVSDTQVTCNAPAGSAGAVVDVVVTNANGSDTDAGGFRYHALPSITGVAPGNGPAAGGTSVTISGAGFLVDGAGVNTVTVDGVIATSVVTLSDSSITCDVPAGAGGATVDVVVSNANGADTEVGGYRYHALPSISSITPSSGPSAGGTSLVIDGAGFADDAAGPNTVTIDGVPATAVVTVSDVEIQCDAPAGTPGATVDVVVTNANGADTAVDGFRYHALPDLTLVSPGAGPAAGGTTLTLAGTGFQVDGAGANAVTVDGAPATGVTTVSDTRITCTAPAGAAGATVDVVVSNTNGSDTGVGAFRYHAAPTLTGVAPGQGDATGGTSVTLTGSGFLDDAPGVNGVTFAGVAATSVAVLSDTTITCVAPAGTAGSAATVVVTNANGSVNLAAAYTYLGPPDAAASTVVASPGAGVAADGVATSLVTVTVRDAFGAPLAGRDVSVVASGGGATVGAPPPTDGAGVTTTTVASTVAEPKRLTATVDPGPSQVVLDDTPDVEFVWALANTYYVRASGSDAADGASPATAWQTLSHAALTVVAGDTVHVGAGTYDETVVVTTDGTPLAPIHFLADPSGSFTGDAGAVVVDGGAASTTVQLDGSDHVRFAGFTLLGTGTDGIVRVGPTAATGVEVTGNTIQGGAIGVQLENAVSPLLETSVVSNTTGAASIVVDTSSGATLRGNLVYNGAGKGVRVTGGSTGLLIEACTLYLCSADHVAIDASSNSVTIRDCVISQGAGDGIELLSGSSATSTYNVVYGHAGADWNGLSSGTGDVNLDPLFVDPDGLDGLLGGAQGADDSFHLDFGGASPAIDAGSADADTLALSDGTVLADRTTRTDGTLDGTAPDGTTANIGYHYPHAPGSPITLEADDVRLVHGTSGSREVRHRSYDASGTSWSAAGLAPPTGATVRWTLVERSPLDDGEEAYAFFAEDGSTSELELLRWSGEAWFREWSTTAIDPAEAGKRAFDLVHEQASGDLLVVYSDDTPTPVFRVRTGGNWSAEASLPLNDGVGPFPDVNSKFVQWVELVAREGSDEIALVYVDDGDDLVAIMWDGSSWVQASASLLEDDVMDNPITNDVGNRAFDAAFESLSGDLMVCWGEDNADGFEYAVKPAGSSSFEVLGAVTSAPANGSVNFLDIAAEPGTDRIAGAFMDQGNGTERLGLATWDGGAWIDAGEYDSQTYDVNDESHGDFTGTVAWLGATGTAVCVYPDDQTGTLDWATWTAGGGWTVEADVAVAGKGYSESMLLASLEASGDVVLVLSDTNDDLYALTYDGTSWTILNGGAPLETDLPNDESVAFGFTVERD